MIHVWYSNQLERLAGRLVANLGASREDARARLFAMPPIIVPGQVLENYLRYEIAQGAGIAAGLEFHLPETFVTSLRPPQARPEARLLDRGALRAFFLDVLEEGTDAATLPEPVRAYLDAAGADADARDLRRFQLASRLGRQFALYGEDRPERLRTKRDDDSDGSADGTADESAAWQQALWGRVGGEGGPILRARSLERARWLFPFELYPWLDENGLAPPAEVHVFGFSYAWGGCRRLLAFLDRTSIVHVYAPTPGLVFRDDLGPRERQGELFAKGPPKRAGRKPSPPVRVPFRDDDPDDLPIVREWGRPVADLFRILGEREGAVFHPEFSASPRRSSVLGRLQRQILLRERGEVWTSSSDESLAVLACPGIRREAEVVAGEIWRMVADDDRQHGAGPGRLRFREIGVALADSANLPAYQAHLRAAFEELHGIPNAMVELPLAGECRSVEAVLLLLALPLGQFTRPELLKVLTHPALRAKFPEADTARWAGWCEALEIVHGADASDHQGTYLERCDLFHWEQGLRRLVLGVFMTGTRGGDDRTFPLDGADYPPLDEPAEALADVARLLALVRSIVADVRFARTAELTLTEWSAFLARMVNAYLGADSAVEQRALSACVQEIHALKALDVSGRRFGYRIPLECLREALGGLTGSRGHVLADGIVVGPIEALRGVPFRALFVCGLGEGRFPSSEGPDAADQPRGRRRVGEVSPRERDRLLFLETIARTRDRLTLSYVARDSQTGETLEPSPLIHELIDQVNQGRTDPRAGLEIRTHPLRRYAPEYFSQAQEPKPASRGFRTALAPAARKEATARRLRASLADQGAWDLAVPPDSLRRLDRRLVDWLGLCPLPEASTTAAGPSPRVAISLREIRRFLECPLQGWARMMLRLREEELEDLATREDEHFSTDRLPATVLLREVFLESLGLAAPSNGDPARFEALYAAHAEALARLGAMPVGLFRDAERRNHLAYLHAWHDLTQRRGLADRGPFRIYRFGRAAENERVDRLEAAIPIDVTLRGGSGGPSTVRVELFGRTEMVSGRLPGSLTPITREAVSDRDFLAGFLDATVLSLLPEHHDPAEYHAHLIHLPGTGKPPDAHRVFRAIDGPRARQFLADVLADMLGGTHAYLLPCEAVFAALSKGEPIGLSVERMKEDDRAACSSRYGPVTDFTLYDPPDEDEARAMIERRFALFRDSGGLGE